MRIKRFDMPNGQVWLPGQLTLVVGNSGCGQEVLLGELAWNAPVQVRISGFGVGRRPGCASADRRLACWWRILRSYRDDDEYRSAVDDAIRGACGPGYQGLVFDPLSVGSDPPRVGWEVESGAPSFYSLGLRRYLMLACHLLHSGLMQDYGVVLLGCPEVGMDPGLLALLAECIVDASRHAQVVVSTYSPELMSGVSGASRRAGVALAVSYFSRGVDGCSRIKNFAPGSLDGWLCGTSLGELYAGGNLDCLDPDAERPSGPLAPLDLPSQDELLRSMVIEAGAVAESSPDGSALP